MNRKELIKIIEHLLLNAPIRFEHVSGVSSWQMPESWIVAQVMLDVNNEGFWGIPEVSINQNLSDFESGGKEMSASDISDLRGAKIDLFVGEKSNILRKIRARVIMEVKGSQSTWSAFGKDIERVRKLSSLLKDGDQAAMLAYVTAPLTAQEKNKDFKNFMSATGLHSNEIKVAPIDGDSERRAYVFTHIIER